MKKVKRQPKVDRHRLARSRARVYYLKPDPDKPHRVKLYLSPNRRHMHATAAFVEGTSFENHFNGMVRSYTSYTTGHSVVRPRFIIATMYMNVVSMRADPGEIVSHECAHAAMAWARLRKADLSKMAGEEVMCYAIGRMVQQLHAIGYMARVW